MKVELHFMDGNDYIAVIDHDSKVAGSLTDTFYKKEEYGSENYQYFINWNNKFKKLVIYED